MIIGTRNTKPDYTLGSGMNQDFTRRLEKKHQA